MFVEIVPLYIKSCFKIADLHYLVFKMVSLKLPWGNFGEIRCAQVVYGFHMWD